MIISGLANEVALLNRTIESCLAYDNAKEEAFNRLYAELEDLKKDASFNRIRPLYIDLILLFDRIESVRQEIIPSPISALLKTLGEEIVEILYRQGVEIIHTSSPSFDPTVQQAVGIQSVTDKGENNEVARMVRKGFKCGDHLLRAGEVIVKRYKAIVESHESS